MLVVVVVVARFVVVVPRFVAEYLGTINTPNDEMIQQQTRAIVHKETNM